ncbi:hypothetical protein D3C87_590530 [compost metagenome]
MMLIYGFILIQVLLGIHFIMPLILYVIKKNRSSLPDKSFLGVKELDYAVIITAYEQVTLIPMVVDSILNSDYSNYLVYIVADKCEVSGLKFDDERIIVLRPEEVLASNVKSHFYAIERFRRTHDCLTIIDSDNLVHKNYFHELNQFFSLGYEAIQGVRAAKNLDSTYACLDEAGDIFYRLIDRKLMFEAGSSAALSGSGMAFTIDLYKECLEQNKVKGAGFDKILQYEILSAGKRIAFAEKAIVYDEKTSKTDQLVNQRSRWINTWFKFLFLGGKLLLESLKKANLNQFLFSMMLLRPPLFVLFFITGAFVVLDMFLFPEVILFWVFALIIFFITVFKALSYFKADEKIYYSLKNAPKFMYFQVLALLKARKANQVSVATKHYYQEKITNDA